MNRLLFISLWLFGTQTGYTIGLLIFLIVTRFSEERLAAFVVAACAAFALIGIVQEKLLARMNIYCRRWALATFLSLALVVACWIMIFGASSQRENPWLPILMLIALLAGGAVLGRAQATTLPMPLRARATVPWQRWNTYGVPISAIAAALTIKHFRFPESRLVLAMTLIFSVWGSLGAAYLFGRESTRMSVIADPNAGG